MVSSDNCSDVSADLLKGVSRSFFMTIRVLPKSMREPIGLAYLLARAADTVADANSFPAEARLRHLATWRARLNDPSARLPAVLSGGGETGNRWDESELRLLQAAPCLFNLLDDMAEDDKRNVRRTLDTLFLGMEYDLTKFPAPDSGRVAALDSFNDLDRYMYLVAGCVGEFWTDLMIAHGFAGRQWDRERMADCGVRFGKALQMTNIIRDVPNDLRVGRCYVPREVLESAGLTIDDLRDPRGGERARPAFITMAGRALEFYVSAGEYVLATPRRSARVRLAMIWPILIGLATLHLVIRNPDRLNPDERIRVSRTWLYWMMIRSVPCAWSNSLFSYWSKRLRRRLRAALRSETA